MAGAETLGFKWKSVTFGLSVEGILIRNKIKKALHEKHGVIKDRKQIMDERKKHDIEGIKETEDDMTNRAKKTTELVHATFFHTGLILDRELGFLMKIANENNDIIKKLPDGSKHSDRLKKINKRLVGVLDEVNDELKEDQKVIFAIEKRTEGEEGYALKFRAAMTAKDSLDIMKRFTMMYEVKKIVKDEKKIEGIEEKVHALRNKIVGKKQVTDKDLEEIEKEEEEMLNLALDEAKNSYKLIINDYLMMNIIVGVLNEDIELTEEDMKTHEIPLVMGQLNEKQKKEVLAFVKKELHTEHIELNQLFDDARDAKAAAS
ncbi:hypothetical protein ACFL0W_04735 [Nanoarchaeota archaeon]